MLRNGLTHFYKGKHFYFQRFLSDDRINSEILSDLFGLSTAKAKLFIETNKLQNRNADMVMNCTKFCRNLGYTNNEILKTPGLLRVHPLELEQHYLSLEEGGFKDIGPKILARARNYMKRLIISLKSKQLISKDTNVAKSFLSYIEDEEIVRKVAIDCFSDKNKWNEVHKYILESFLKLKLNATDDEIIRLFRIHRMIKNKSFRIIQENIAIAEDLGFEPKKLLKYGYLLHNYPNYPKCILKDFSNLAGSDMKKAMRMYPKLIMTSPTNIIKIYGILKEFNIDDEVIRKQMNVFHMSPDTVRLRLEEIEQSPDFKVLLNHPRVLSLIVHHNRAKSRLSFLQQLQLRCASLTILGTDQKETFDNYVREGKDTNRISDVDIFLKTLFNVDVKQIKKKIKGHPYYLQVPLKEMQNTYDYLISQHFKHDNIFKVLHILLYPQDKIEKAINELKTSTQMNYKSLKQVKRLSLILYFIEKEYHFTGNGIWNKSDKIEANVPENTLE